MSEETKNIDRSTLS